MQLVKREVKKVRESGEIPRKSRNISSCHLSSPTFLVRSQIGFKQGKSMLPSNYHVIYMGTSYSGSVGQILTLTHVNLWFITKKPGRCGEANTERRDLVPAIYPINEPDCRKRCYRLCANDTAKSYVLCCLCVLFCPRAIPWLYLHLETITTETESLQEPSVHLSFAVSGLF